MPYPEKVQIHAHRFRDHGPDIIQGFSNEVNRRVTFVQQDLLTLEHSNVLMELWATTPPRRSTVDFQMGMW